MIEKILITTALGSIGLSGISAPKEKVTDKPNIIVIMTDDQGYGDLSCQHATDMKTPNIDKLFSRGVVLTDFHANSTVSSPSRAGLLTGRFPDMVGVPGVIRTTPTASWGYLSANAVLLPQMLKQRGYKSAIIGKWHLGLESPNTPNERGFDYFHGFLGDMMDDYYTHLRQGNNYMRENDKVIDPKGHATDIFTDWAIEYVEKQKNDPFFLYLAYNAPHVPLNAPEEWEQRVRSREKGISEKRGKLVAMIEHLDYNIGKLVSNLEKIGKIDNTIIIFTSDNGGDRGAEANNGPLRGAKGDMFEGGTKVPFAICWNGRIEPCVKDNFVMMSDVFPTLCDILSIPIDHRIDGISIAPLLRGEQQITDERYSFWVRREHADFGGRTQSAVRYKNYKLLQNKPFEAMQFYDLEKDPMEASPLKMNGEQYTKLYKNMTEHYRQSGAVAWQKQENQ